MDFQTSATGIIAHRAPRFRNSENVKMIIKILLMSILSKGKAKLAFSNSWFIFKVWLHHLLEYLLISICIEKPYAYSDAWWSGRKKLHQPNILCKQNWWRFAMLSNQCGWRHKDGTYSSKSSLSSTVCLYFHSNPLEWIWKLVSSMWLFSNRWNLDDQKLCG